MEAGRCFASATRCTRACSSALSRTEYTLDRSLFGRVGTTPGGNGASLVCSDSSRKRAASAGSIVFAISDPFQVERQVGPGGGPGVDAVEVAISVPERDDHQHPPSTCRATNEP